MRVDMTEEGKALIVLNNSSEIAMISNVIAFWNRRWPVQDYFIERIDEEFVQALNEAWKINVDKENLK